MAPLVGPRREGKVAIAGAGRGIGVAHAERFRREGASVIVAEIDADGGKHAAESLAEIATEFVHTDVTSPDSGKHMPA